jgi:hypothetical protein
MSVNSYMATRPQCFGGNVLDTWLSKLFVVALVAIFSAGLPYSTSAENHDLVVLVLDGNSGKPFEHTWLSINWHDGRPRALGQKTNSSGVAVFHLTDPLPERIGISTGLEVGLCSEGMPFSTEEILKNGVISKNVCSGAKFQYSTLARPGQVVVFAKRGWTLWQRMLEEIP